MIVGRLPDRDRSRSACGRASACSPSRCRTLRGWDRETFAFAIAVQNLLWGLGQPFAGAIADRFGAGRVLAAGGAIYALGVALMSVSTSGAALALTGGVLVGLGLAGGSFTIVIAAFARLVPEDRRSWAMGLATAAGSMGQFLFAPLGQGFISAYGAGDRAAAAARLRGARADPRRRAERPRRRATDGRSRRVRAARRCAQASRHPSYMLLTAGFFVCGFHIAFISTHLPAYLTDLGLEHGLAAWSLGADRPVQRDRRVHRGRARRHLSASGCCWPGSTSAAAVAFALFLLLPATPLTVLVFAAAIGLLWLSTVPLTSGLVALMFGTRHVGMLFGIVFLSHQVGAFVGALAGRRGLRGDRHLRPDVVCCASRSASPRRSSTCRSASAARRAGAEPGMSRLGRDLLIGVALTLVAFFGVLYQVAASSAKAGANSKKPLPRLICPLH